MAHTAQRTVHWPWLAAVVAVSAHFALSHDWNHRPYFDARAQSLYIDGHAAMPFNARILMSGIMHLFAGSRAVSAVASHAPTSLHSSFLIVQTVCVFLSMVVAIAATRATLRLLTGNAIYADAACFLLPLMVYFNLVLSYGLTYTLPYDLPSLAFFATAIYLIARQQWLLFYPVFVLAMLNRETAIFLAIIAAAWTGSDEGKQGMRRVLPHFAAQIALAIGIKVWLVHHLGGTSVASETNSFVTLKLKTNLHSLINPAQWPLFLSLFAFSPIPLWLGRRDIRHRGLALATAVTVPLWIACMMVVGVIVEVRVFNELASLLALVAALEAWHRWFQTSTPEIS